MGNINEAPMVHSDNVYDIILATKIPFNFESPSFNNILFHLT